MIGAYGDVQWTRNLRAAGEADVEVHGRREHVFARQLDVDEATEWYRTVLRDFVGRLPWFGRAFARMLFSAVGPEILDDPAAAARTKPVFELRSA